MSQNADSSFKVGDCVRVGGLSRQSPVMRVLFVNDTELDYQGRNMFVPADFCVCAFFSDGMVWCEICVPADILEVVENKSFEVMDAVSALVKLHDGTCPPHKKIDFENMGARRSQGQYQSVINGARCCCTIEDRCLELVEEKFFWCRVCYLIVPDVDQTHCTPKELAGYIDELRSNLVVPDIAKGGRISQVMIGEELAGVTKEAFDAVSESLSPDEPLVDHLADFDDSTLMNGQVLGVSSFDAQAGPHSVGELRKKGYRVLRDFNGNNYFWKVEKLMDKK